MENNKKNTQQSDHSYQERVDAISKSFALIEFDMDGRILEANENFLNAMGYRRDEVVGKHHSMFVPKDYSTSPEYQTFWAVLKRGDFQSGEFGRVNKDGDPVWIQAAYSPVCDEAGVPYKIIKVASDITEAKIAAADLESQVEAIARSQAVIEFDLEGTILHANENFLAAMGYALEEIKGNHHSMFVDHSYASSPEYRSFWAALKKGEFQTGEFARVGRDGKQIYIQASYSPVFGPDGKPYKIGRPHG